MSESGGKDSSPWLIKSEIVSCFRSLEDLPMARNCNRRTPGEHRKRKASCYLLLLLLLLMLMMMPLLCLSLSMLLLPLLRLMLPLVEVVAVAVGAPADGVDFHAIAAADVVANTVVAFDKVENVDDVAELPAAVAVVLVEACCCC